jgi:hypothetical protein
MGWPAELFAQFMVPMKTLCPLTAAGLLALATVLTGRAGGLTFNDLNPDEKALYDKGAIMELYEPNKPGGHYVDSVGITAVKRHTKSGEKLEKVPPEPILIFVFGIEDATAARSEGQSMAESHYSRSMAESFLLLEGWDKYHDRFFTRAYLQEGMNAYEKGRK